MNKTIRLLFLMIAASTPAMAQKITIEYAHDFDFSSVGTYQYVDTNQSNTPDQLTHDRIKHGIIRELHESGLMSASSDADLYVTYHLISRENPVYNTTGFGYNGFHDGWGPWGDSTSSATTAASTTAEGTLIIDAYDAMEKKIVWHATGTVKVDAKAKKRQKQLDKILAKLGKKWEKILAGQGK